MRLWSLVLVLWVTALSGCTKGDIRVTKSSISDDAAYWWLGSSPTDAKQVFSTEDEKVTLAVRFAHNFVGTYFEYRVDWVAPTGNVYLRAPTRTQWGSHHDLIVSLPVRGHPAASLDGGWKARLYLNDRLLVERDFALVNAQDLLAAQNDVRDGAGSLVTDEDSRYSSSDQLDRGATLAASDGQQGVRPGLRDPSGAEPIVTGDVGADPDAVAATARRTQERAGEQGLLAASSQDEVPIIEVRLLPSAPESRDLWLRQVSPPSVEPGPLSPLTSPTALNEGTDDSGAGRVGEAEILGTRRTPDTIPPGTGEPLRPSGGAIHQDGTLDAVVTNQASVSSLLDEQSQGDDVARLAAQPQPNSSAVRGSSDSRYAISAQSDAAARWGRDVPGEQPSGIQAGSEANGAASRSSPTLAGRSRAVVDGVVQPDSDSASARSQIRDQYLSSGSLRDGPVGRCPSIFHPPADCVDRMPQE